VASRFHFHGEAIGFTGRLHVPFEHIIPVQAPAVLSEIGGYSAGTACDFRFRELIRFDRTHTEVTGSETGDVYATMIQSTIEGLDINGMLSADRIVGRIYSSYRDTPDGEPAIRVIGSRFENLKIAGIPVEVELATDVFDRLDKHHKVVEAFDADDDFRSLFGEITQKEQFDDLFEGVRKWFHRPPKEGSGLPANKGFTELSLVRKLTPLAPGLPYFGHVIRIEGFGTIRLATLQISRFTRRLIMVHVALGSAFKGSVVACEIQDGGTEW